MASNSIVDTVRGAGVQERPDDKVLAAQLAKPTGEFGIKVAEKMNEVNRFITMQVYDVLQPRSTDRILEIGFGNGYFLRDLAARVSNGRIDGIDISQDMVTAAEGLLKDLIEQDKVDVQYGSIEDIPFEDSLFDGACTMNTVYFWENPVRAMSEIKRVLKPGGKFVVGLRSKRSMTDSLFDHGFTKYSEEDIRQLFTDSGFAVTHFSTHEDNETPVEGVQRLEIIVIAGTK